MGYILGDFSTILSGHPDCFQVVFSWRGPTEFSAGGEEK
jgi:hypothetical protein